MKTLKGKCPVCDADITATGTIEQSEILNCPDCKTRVVVEEIKNNKLVLAPAPQVEEDWGE